MSCLERQIDITAYIDQSLEADQVEALQAHLKACTDCQRFYEEQLAFDQFLKENSTEADPPIHIWNKISAEIEARQASRQRSWWGDFWAHFEIPQLVYGFAALLLFGLASILALQVYEDFSAHPAYLAELDSFSVDVSDNPFLDFENKSSENPFWDSMVSGEIVDKTNPFERYEEVVR